MTLTPGIRRAVEEMGFITATDIQAQSIPLIQEGRDVIGRSQTGTGKTLAFGIPAIECIDTSSEIRTSAQVLVLCPTRELAVQACEELRKLARYTPGIRTADVYGGAPICLSIGAPPYTSAVRMYMAAHRWIDKSLSCGQPIS